MSNFIADLIKLDDKNLRDFFAMMAPRPTKDRIKLEMQRDQMNNPHNDSYGGKPVRRGEMEIICDLRYLFADEMMRARDRNYKQLINAPGSGRSHSASRY